MPSPIAARLLLVAALGAAFAAPALTVSAQAAPQVKRPSPYPSPLEASGPVELVVQDDGVKVNWSSGMLSVSGTGLPGDRGPMTFRKALAARAATADAYRRLSHALEVVPVDENSRVKDLEVNDQTVHNHLNELVKTAKVLATNYWPDGTAEVVLGVSLHGSHSLASAIGLKEATPSPAPSGSPSPSPAPNPSPSIDVVTTPLPLHADYTALIVEAKDAGAAPVLQANLRDDKTKVIALDGPRSYFKGGAEFSQAAGFNPLRISARHAHGLLKGDLVLSPGDTATLKAAMRDQKLPANAPVVIVL